jgi:hypothetical protein
VATASAFFRLRQGGKTINFVRFGDFAAKTNEKDSPSLLPQAENARCGQHSKPTA